MLNHLIHVGFPKAGSKSLQQWFERHPGFAFTQWGIAGAADAWRFEEIFAFQRGVRCAVTSYEGFVSPVPDHMKLDFDDVSALVPPRESIIRLAEAMADLFRGARILIVTRGFRELCLSYYAEAVVTGCLRTCDDFCRSFFVREDGTLSVDYDLVIGLYERLFGAGNVLVLPFELLREDPGRFAGEIESAAGVARSGVAPDWVHRSPTPAELLREVRLRRLARAVPIGRERVLGTGRKLIETRLFGPLLERFLARSRDRRASGPVEVPAEVLERFRGTAERLRHRPFYAGLEAEYFL